MSSSQPLVSDESFLSVIHDVRACLRKSLTNVQLLERLIGSSLDASAKVHLDAVLAANKEMAHLLGRLSDYANAGHISSSMPLPLLAVVQNSVLQFPSKQITLGEVPSSIGQAVVPQELVRVFTELLDNALKFSKGAPVAIRFDSEPPEISTMILDTGVGIAAGEEDRVFGLLTRLHSADDFPGFGIGLPICRRTADAVGASVILSANPAGGTIAKVTVRYEPQ